MAFRQDDGDAPLQRARAYIDDCYHLPLDLSQISSQAGYSRYHFIRLFSQTFDITPHQYLTRRRIEKAKDLLRSGELSVTEVCFAVGFQSPGSFSSLFHRSVGYPPAVYRTRMFRGIALPRTYIPACFVTMFGLARRAPV
jgi:AraC-like DNA-binding protein